MGSLPCIMDTLVTIMENRLRMWECIQMATILLNLQVKNMFSIRFSFPDQIRLCNSSWTLLSKHREKTYALKLHSQILSMPALSGFTLSLIVDRYHVILMADFPESLLLVSAECSLCGKKEHS